MNANVALLYSVLFLSKIIFANSCINSTRKIETQIHELLGKELILNDTLIKYSIATLEPIKAAPSFGPKIVTYIQRNCDTCLSDLIEWRDFINQLDLNSISFYIYIGTHDWDHIKMYLVSWGFNLPIIIDVDDYFFQQNDLILNSTFNTFLLDKENRIILVGNPLRSTEMASLYITKINGLTNTDN